MPTHLRQTAADSSIWSKRSRESQDRGVLHQPAAATRVHPRVGSQGVLWLGGAFALIGVVWLCGYAIVAAKAADLLSRRRVKVALDRITGLVLIALGVRLALERR